jgi:hypothetical protein
LSRLRRFAGWAGRLRVSNKEHPAPQHDAMLANWNVVLDRYETFKRQRDELERNDPESQEAKELGVAVQRIRPQLDTLRAELTRLGISLPPIKDE